MSLRLVGRPGRPEEQAFSTRWCEFILEEEEPSFWLREHSADKAIHASRIGFAVGWVMADELLESEGAPKE